MENLDLYFTYINIKNFCYLFFSGFEAFTKLFEQPYYGGFVITYFLIFLIIFKLIINLWKKK